MGMYDTIEFEMFCPYHLKMEKFKGQTKAFGCNLYHLDINNLPWDEWCSYYEENIRNYSYHNGYVVGFIGDFECGLEGDGKLYYRTEKELRNAILNHVFPNSLIGIVKRDKDILDVNTDIDYLTGKIDCSWKGEEK